MVSREREERMKTSKTGLDAKRRRTMAEEPPRHKATVNRSFCFFFQKEALSYFILSALGARIKQAVLF
jgi:hypothetical protein